MAKRSKGKLETSVNEYFGWSSGEVSVTEKTVTINCTEEEALEVSLALAAGVQHRRRQNNGHPTTTLKSHLERINTIQLVFKNVKGEVPKARQTKMSCSILGRLFRRREPQV